MKFTPVRLAQSQLTQLAISDGQLIFAYDTGNVYVDTALGRFQQGISMLEDSTQLPLAPADKLYFNKEKKQLLYDGKSIDGSMQKAAVQTDTQAQVGKWYLCLSNINVDLPSQHTENDSIKISTVQDVNSVTIRPAAGQTIQSDSGFLLDINNASVQFMWDGDKWVVAQVITPGQAVGFAIVNELPSQGDQKLYYNKVDNKLYYYTGSEWQTNSYVPQYNVKLGKCTDLGIVFQSDSIQLFWRDPVDVELNTAVLAQWNQTRLLKRKGHYPASAMDPLAQVVAVTSRELNNRDSKFNNPVYQDKSQSVYYKLFSQTVGGAWNNLDANCYPMTTDLSWGVVQSIVRAGKGPEFFPVGMVFQVQHSDFIGSGGHGLMFRVVGHDQVAAANTELVHTMCLDMTNTVMESPYDSSQVIYALTADITAQQGKTYYIYQNDQYTALTAGTDYQVGDTVPQDTWYEKNNENRGTGSNNFATSNILQWANSSGQSGKWFVKQTIWDGISSGYNIANGFCRHIDQQFLNVVAAASVTTAKCAYDGGGSQTVQAKFWPISITQLNGTQNNSIDEGQQLTYYAQGGSKLKYSLDGGTALFWWTRSPYTSYPHTAFYVNTSGEVNWNLCTGGYGISLACIIA